MLETGAQPGVVSPRSESVTIIALGAFVTAALTLIFFSFYWNRFIGIRSGTGAFGGASAMLQGIYPYRDYFTAATPLNAVKSWLVLLLFGDTLTVLRAFDVLERTALGLLVYFWLVRLFRARDAAVAAIVTDHCLRLRLFRWHQFLQSRPAIILAVASGFAGTLILGKRLPSWAFVIAAVVSGLLSSLSFDTKQTIGLGATFAIPFVVTLCVLRLEGWRRSVLFLGLFAAGWAAGAGLLLLWLGSMHILPEFFQQVFVKGPSAKAASPFVFVTRFVKVTLVAWWAVVPAVIALVLTMRLVLKGNANEADPPPNKDERPTWADSSRRNHCAWFGSRGRLRRNSPHPLRPAHHFLLALRNRDTDRLLSSAVAPARPEPARGAVLPAGRRFIRKRGDASSFLARSSHDDRSRHWPFPSPLSCGNCTIGSGLWSMRAAPFCWPAPLYKKSMIHSILTISTIPPARFATATSTLPELPRNAPA